MLLLLNVCMCLVDDDELTEVLITRVLEAMGGFDEEGKRGGTTIGKGT